MSETGEKEGRRIIESYGATQHPHSPHNSHPSIISLQRRRHSDPILLTGGERGSQEWPVLFGGTPTDEDSPVPTGRPRSRTVQTLPDGTFPTVREKTKPSLNIGQKKTKIPARRLSLPPILESDHSHEPITPGSVKPLPTSSIPILTSQSGSSKSPPPSPSPSSPQKSTYSKYFRWGKG